jgi:Tol biopolymer transport system component
MSTIRFFLGLIAFIALSSMFTGWSIGVKGMIVYAGIAGDGNGSFIYAISPDGKEKKQLTTGVRTDSYPAVSPDGMTVVFSSAGDDYKYRLYAVDGSGKNLREIAETEHDAILASWSPDGKRIAFLDRDSDNATCIYLVNPDGTGLTQIVKGAEHDDDYQYPPVWSADGKRIMYDKKDMKSEDGTMPACLYIVNTDGSGETPFGNHNQTQYDGAWSPDAKRVVYYSQKREFDYNRNDNVGIFVMNSDGTGEAFLVSGLRPIWSPDGSRIAYTTSDTGYDHIFIMYLDGTEPVKADVNNMDDEEAEGDSMPLQVSFDDSPGVKDPIWSPDGQKIAFVTDTGDLAASKLFIADLVGNTQLALTDNVLGRSRPDWK